MITYLEGTLVEAYPTHIVVGVHGVGYHVLIPLSSYDKLPLGGAQIKVLTHLVVREDAHLLYGFMSTLERDLFRLLVNHVSGIGPKTALDVLSGSSVLSFKAAVVANDVAALARIKGIGKKTAERIIVELKDKVGVAAAWEAASAAHAPSPEEVQMNDAVAALITLGYKQVDAHKAVKEVVARGLEKVEREELVRQALKLLLK
jgi:Holliday junction DNA helicase RuvA